MGISANDTSQNLKNLELMLAETRPQVGGLDRRDAGFEKKRFPRNDFGEDGNSEKEERFNVETDG
jgi:hypothetical protein